ncbi:MAG TPA: PLD nuclease N-terminal domain-containing protein [Thermoleophilaceae bacterium]|nr:PLD nuclease N-terminal domain-containing protein [Thermoleophilaceae bacterium]
MPPLAASAFEWVFILLPLLVIWVVGVVDVLRRRDLTRQAKAGWAIIVLLFPFMGMLLYLLLRKPTRRELVDAQAGRAGSPRDRSLAQQGVHRGDL